MYTHSTLHFPFASPIFSRLRRVMPVFVGVILTLVVCGIGLAQNAAHSSRPTLIPNKKKYADRGMHPATGRSGSATLTVRAMRGKNGQTDIQATTGVLGQPDAPGHIKNVQLKPLNEDGGAIFTQNYNGLTGGGVFTTSVNYLQHLQQVQARANIDGIDPRRTNVVTVVESVKNRPDLEVTNLTPSTGITGAPINISVIVKELNGDLGASANCVLYVDAGGTVSVAFTHVFQSPGTKQLEVKVESVSPGDWDLANNSVSGQIIITQPNQWFGHFFEQRSP